MRLHLKQDARQAIFLRCKYRYEKHAGIIMMTSHAVTAEQMLSTNMPYGVIDSEASSAFFTLSASTSSSKQINPSRDVSD